MVFFDQNTPAGEWRAQARCCEEQNIALHRNIAFALAVADLLQLPDDLPLMPAVTAAMSIPIRLGDSASLAHLRAVARAAARNGSERRTDSRGDARRGRTFRRASSDRDQTMSRNGIEISGFPISSFTTT